MKPEQIVDALNELDDDIIESVEQVRQKKTSRRRYYHWIGIAACLCFMVTAIYAVQRMGKSGSSSQSGDYEMAEDSVLTIEEGKAHDNENLAMLRLPEIITDGNGFAGVYYYNIPSAMRSFNADTEDKESLPKEEYATKDFSVMSLPVYQNIAYNEMGEACGLSKDEMVKKLEDAADAIGKEILNIDYTHGGFSGSGLTSETTVELTGTTSLADIIVSADGTIELDFKEGFELPNYIQFYRYSVSDKDAKAAIEYLLEYFRELLSFNNPIIVLEGSYNINGDYGNQYLVYNSSENDAENLTNQYFQYAEFIPDEDGDLSMIRIHDMLSCAEKIGEYPIISEEEAQEHLLQGNYITSVPYDISDEKYVSKVELMYRNSWYDEILMPYYCFYVELPEEQLENGLKCFGIYYVPAVEEQYIENMPAYEGQMN